MGTNSIRSNLTKDTTISQIKLSLAADTDKEKVFIILEGYDDIKFLKKFFNNNVILYESFSGKKGVEEIINSEEIQNTRVIGIRDKDYCKYFDKNRIFFYDKCCLEMMLISFDESFYSIYCEFYNGEIGANELRKHILNELKQLSNIRKYNEEYSKKINFKGLSFNNLIDDNGKLDYNNVVKSLNRINSNKEINFTDINKSLEISNTNDLFDITNGHDFILFFKTLCDKNTKKDCSSEKHISSALRTSFSKDFFKKTNLYKILNDYFDNEVDIWS